MSPKPLSSTTDQSSKSPASSKQSISLPPISSIIKSETEQHLFPQTASNQPGNASFSSHIASPYSRIQSPVTQPMYHHNYYPAHTFPPPPPPQVAHPSSTLPLAPSPNQRLSLQFSQTKAFSLPPLDNYQSGYTYHLQNPPIIRRESPLSTQFGQSVSPLSATYSSAGQQPQAPPVYQHQYQYPGHYAQTSPQQQTFPQHQQIASAPHLAPLPQESPKTVNVVRKTPPNSSKKNASTDKVFAFISHSPATFPSQEPSIDNAQLARRKRRRTSSHELSILQNEFVLGSNPNRIRRQQIAEKVKMDEKAVQIWFQNKRQSLKRFKLKNEMKNNITINEVTSEEEEGDNSNSTTRARSLSPARDNTTNLTSVISTPSKSGMLSRKNSSDDLSSNQTTISKASNTSRKSSCSESTSPISANFKLPAMVPTSTPSKPTWSTIKEDEHKSLENEGAQRENSNPLLKVVKSEPNNSGSSMVLKFEKSTTEPSTEMAK